MTRGEKLFLSGWVAASAISILVIVAVLTHSHNAQKTSSSIKLPAGPSPTTQATPYPGNKLGADYNAYDNVIMLNVLSVKHNWDDPKLEAAYRSQTANNAVGNAMTPPDKYTLVQIRYRNLSSKPATFASGDLTAAYNFGLQCGDILPNGTFSVSPPPDYAQYTADEWGGSYPEIDRVYGSPVNYNFGPKEVKQGYAELPGDCKYVGTIGNPGSWWAL